MILDDKGYLDIGFYTTEGGGASTSVGGDLGLLLAYSPNSTSVLDGPSTFVSGGVDTPVVDFSGGVEVTSEGYEIYNFSATLGFEPSALVVASIEGGELVTQTWRPEWK